MLPLIPLPMTNSQIHSFEALISQWALLRPSLYYGPFGLEVGLKFSPTLQSGL